MNITVSLKTGNSSWIFLHNSESINNSSNENSKCFTHKGSPAFIVTDTCARRQRSNLVPSPLSGNCRGAINNKGVWSFGSRRGLLAYVYSGVFVWMNTTECLSGGNCSYIVRLSVRDLHGPTSPFFHLNWASIGLCLNLPNFAFDSTDSMKSLRKTWDLTVLWDRSAF